MRIAFLRGAAVLALATFGLTAQVQKGSAPPAFDFEKVLNDGPTSFDELEGHVVIFEFGATW